MQKFKNIEVNNMQRTGTEAIRTHLQPSKLKREITNITNSQNTKRIYSQPSEQLFPKMWPLSDRNDTKSKTKIVIYLVTLLILTHFVGLFYFCICIFKRDFFIFYLFIIFIRMPGDVRMNLEPCDIGIRSYFIDRKLVDHVK